VNFSINVSEDRLKAIIEAEHIDRIDVIHYHSHATPSGALKSVATPVVDQAIIRANQDIAAIIDQDHDNYLFWSFRYSCFPEVGSGVGSRGEILQQKKQLLDSVVPLFYDKGVLEVGCGDLETSREFAFRNYTGYDLSSEALAIAKLKRPDWRFVQGSLSGSGDHPQADLVICLDVLIHQKKPEDYHNLIAGLVSATRQRLIVSGYQNKPADEFASKITAFHEPLGKTLRRFGVFNEVMEIGRYRGVSMIIADKYATGPEAHPNDLPIDIFNAMAPLVDRPPLLRMTMDHSRAQLGFYTQTSSRMIEYPWVLDKMSSLPAGALVLDIGSGVSPLPPILAQRGLQVACVDSHPMVRTLADRHAWNEWGFFDYSVLSPRIKAFHTDILDFRPNVKFDAVYSVSVLEHMPRTVWEQALRMLPGFLKPGGLLLLTLDLIPGTYDLWNMCSGKVVDLGTPHGGVKELANMVQGLGFVLDELNARQKIPFSRTDVAFLSARLKT
jgi:2-polyprenyl-3-methyl-5-hydroxy-6-metoxy-1,4-benzoquinol methylase